ncbi:MAG: MATE family efflux transporter [Candidatus Gastranaerophilales bacterium]|nr:MATE family efflux transporter [Candidatus Gastranaerophilales bacterium]
MNHFTEKENKMAVMPVNRLMLNMGIPIIISMMLQAVYNIVDSAFVANMQGTGEMALNALTLAFPIQMLMVAVGVGTGVGVNALLAKSMGQGDKEKAYKTAGNGIFLALVIYLIFLLFGIFGVGSYISSQTKNAVIAQMATDYLTICCVWSFGILFFSLYEKVLQATGKSFYSTIAQITGAATNIILDPILIYGLLGLPKMGVQGAAYATVIGQIASALCGFLFHITKNKEVTNGLKYIKPSKNIIQEIYSIGFAAIIAQALMSIMTYLLNIIFAPIGENVVTAYGLYYKIQQFILFAAFGLRDAITPIVSFNYGMQSRERVKAGIQYGLIYTLTIMAIGLIGLEIFSEPLAGIFGLSGETKALCVSAMRVISISYLFAGANIAFQGVFQALDSGLESLVISLCRQFLFIIPVAFFFSKLVTGGFADTWLVWLTFPIGEALTVVIALLFMKKIMLKNQSLPHILPAVQ